MNVETLTLIQGTPEWQAHRAKHFNASDASAMLGLSSYKSRSDLIKEKATGIKPEIDAATQRRFDLGHEYEAMARPWAEEIIGEELFPTVLAADVDGLPLSASLDGQTMLGDITFEHKTLNSKLEAAMEYGEIPEEYWPQLEQGLLLAGADRCLFMASNGDKDTMRHAWYYRDDQARATVLNGWKQFAEDLANYQHVSTKDELIVGRAPDTLPALQIEVTGMVTASNLAEFKATAMAVFGGINTNLHTDQDFADAEKAVKFCKDAEARLDAAKSHALSQTASIDDLFRTIDAIKEEARTVRLRLEKLVKARKETIRYEIVGTAELALSEHISKLNTRIGGNWMPKFNAGIGDAIKGLKTVASIMDKVDTALANAKIKTNEIADIIEINKNSMTSHDWPLVPDFAALCTKDPGDFAAIVALRISQHEAEQQLQAQAKADMEAKAAAAMKAAQDQCGNPGDTTHAQQYATAAPQVTPASTTPFTKEDGRAAVVEHQDDISTFLNTRDFKDESRIRAILVEFVKHQAARSNSVFTKKAA